MNRCRELGATYELCLGGRQVDEGEIPGGKCVTVSLVATDSPHLRAEKVGGPLSVAVGEVEQIVGRTPTISSGLTTPKFFGRRSGSLRHRSAMPPDGSNLPRFVRAYSGPACSTSSLA